jgi:NAD-dependent DNA ligase
MADDKRFIYRDAQGVVSYREVTNISETEEYIQAFCKSANALRTFRKDRILEDINEPSNIEQRLQYHIENSPPQERPQSSRSYTRRLNTSGAPEICFTGFKKTDKIKLVEIAESEGMFVRDSVTKQLEFLCCGYNAGPKKIEKSRHQGAIVLNEEQFLTMLKTGEIPEK